MRELLRRRRRRSSRLPRGRGRQLSTCSTTLPPAPSRPSGASGFVATPSAWCISGRTTSNVSQDFSRHLSHASSHVVPQASVFCRGVIWNHISSTMKSCVRSRHRMTKTARSPNFLAEKQSILNSKPTDRIDNLKPASGAISDACMRILGLAQRGNNAKAFMRDTLAPLITPGMAIYRELKRDIFGLPKRIADGQE